MIALILVPDGEGNLPELADAKEADELKVAGLAKGTQSGAPSVTIVLRMPDGSVTYAQTTLKLFLAAADGLKARYGDPRFPN